MTPIQNLKSKIQNRLAALLLLLLAATIRLDHGQDRAIWRATAPGIKIVALRDRQAGPCVWLYFRGEFVGRWQWDEPERRPERGPGELKEA